jgi:hypothetical protein
MSLPTSEQAARFLSPLKGSLTVVLLHDAQSRGTLSSFLLGCASRMPLEATVLDVDAFYCANMATLVDEGRGVPKGEAVLLPDHELEVTSLIPLLTSKRQLLVIDDLNSLYSLAPDGRRSRELTVFLRLLAYNARLNGSWAVATAYRANVEDDTRAASQRSIPAVGDIVVDTEVKNGSMKLKAKGLWPGDELRV